MGNHASEKQVREWQRIVKQQFGVFVCYKRYQLRICRPKFKLVYSKLFGRALTQKNWCDELESQTSLLCWSFQYYPKKISAIELSTDLPNEDFQLIWSNHHCDLHIRRSSRHGVASIASYGQRVSSLWNSESCCRQDGRRRGDSHTKCSDVLWAQLRD